MKKLLILAILLIGLSGCKKDDPVEPTPTPPVVEQGFGCIEVHVSNMNINTVTLLNGWDKYEFNGFKLYQGSAGDYSVKCCDIKNIEYDYSITYKTNNTVSKGKVTVLKDKTVVIWGI